MAAPRLHVAAKYIGFCVGSFSGSHMVLEVLRFDNMLSMEFLIVPSSQVICADRSRVCPFRTVVVLGKSTVLVFTEEKSLLTSAHRFASMEGWK